MALTNQIVKTQEEQPRTISAFLDGDKVKKMLTASLGSEKARQSFTSNIVSCVSANPALQNCDFSSVVSGGLLATSLQLSLNPSLGFCYLVPFEDRKNNRTVATFILSYKGYIQLAIRSGLYKDIGTMEVKEGEYKGKDPTTGKPVFEWIVEDDERDEKKTIGYMAYFEYLNGFKKVIYWSKEKMLKHADQYSKAFSKDAVKSQYPNKCRASFADFEAGKVPESEMWKYSSYWYKAFDLMAQKTLIRQLISKWGVMSIEMQKAYEADKDELDEKVFMPDTPENDFFGNSEGLEKPDVVEVEEKIVPKSARKGRKKADAIENDGDGLQDEFFAEDAPV